MSINRSVRAAHERLDLEQLYTPSEVAALLRVDPKTVARWAQQGKLPSIRTLGGHRRYRAADIEPLLQTQVIVPR